jgi:hemerythrin superfamily protein
MPAQKLNDAIKLLTQDHKDVDALFKRYDKLSQADGPAAQKAELARQICAMLTVHATIEEEIFYPAARAALKEQDLLDEAEVEHASAKELIAQIEGASPDSALYDAKVKVLGEYIRHHVKEEQDEMFPKVRRTRLDLVLVGEALASRKQELMGTTVPA